MYLKTKLFLVGNLSRNDDSFAKEKHPLYSITGEPAVISCVATKPSIFDATNICRANTSPFKELSKDISP